jgi:flagellar biosynthesis regulator FlbT
MRREYGDDENEDFKQVLQVFIESFCNSEVVNLRDIKNVKRMKAETFRATLITTKHFLLSN